MRTPLSCRRRITNRFARVVLALALLETDIVDEDSGNAVVFSLYLLILSSLQYGYKCRSLELVKTDSTIVYSVPGTYSYSYCTGVFSWLKSNE